MNNHYWLYPDCNSMAEIWWYIIKTSSKWLPRNWAGPKVSKSHSGCGYVYFGRFIVESGCDT